MSFYLNKPNIGNRAGCMTLIEKITSSKKSYVLAVIVLMLAIVVTRAAFITADPPPDLSISGALYSDEGFKTFAARNRALYGSWKWTPLDGYDGWVSKSPLSQYTYAGLFSLLGTGIAPIRMVSLLYSFAAAIIFFFFLKKQYGNETALWGLALYGLNYFNTMFGRMGFYEVHIIFYFMLAVFSFSLMAGSKKARLKIAYFMLFAAAITASWYIKRSIVIVAFASAPAFLLYLLNRSGVNKKAQQRIFMLFILAAGMIYLVAVHCPPAAAFLKTITRIQVGGTTLGKYFSFRSFDPIYTALGRGLYLEVIFLQPLTFFGAALYSLYAFFRYFRDEAPFDADVIFASWFIFGFLILSAMAYHPARYYLIITPPLFVMAIQALRALPRLADFLKRPLPPAYSLSLNAVKVLFVLYAVVVIAVQLVPFQARRSVIHSLYPYLSRGQISPLIPYAAAVLVFLCLVVSAIVLNRKKLYQLLGREKAGFALMSIILVFHLAQYGGWVLFHKSETVQLSQRLGRSLPENAIIAGSWSAQLVIENRLRALILQDKSKYNHNVMNKLLRNSPIPVVSPSVPGGLAPEKDIPLYLAVCPDVVFEKRIAARYARYIKPSRCIDSASLGYFTIKVYRIK